MKENANWNFILRNLKMTKSGKGNKTQRDVI